MRLIDADALRADAITRSGGSETAFDMCYPFWQFSQSIAQAPTIEAVPVVHGRWDGPFRVDANHNGYKCSVCGYFGVPGWVACPKCAARMDGGGNV